MEDKIMKMLGMDLTNDTSKQRMNKRMIQSLVASNRESISSSIHETVSQGQTSKQDIASQIQIMSFEGKNLSPEES